MTDLEKLKNVFTEIGLKVELDSVFEGTEISISTDDEKFREIGCDLNWIIFLCDDDGKFLRIETY